MDVGIVERRVHLVEHAEWARAEVEDREQEGQSGQGALTTGEQRHGLQALAPRLRHQVDARVEGIAAFFGLHEPQLRAAAFEQPLEDLREVAVDLLEGLDEAFLRGVRHSPQRLLEVLDRRGEVVVLCAQKREPLVELAILLVGDEVDGADGGQFLRELSHPLAKRREVPVGIVAGQQRGRIHAVRPLGVERQLLASDTPLGRLQLEFVHRAHQAMEIALGRAQLLLDAAQPVQERLVGFRRLARRRLRAVAVHRHVARCRIRALPLLLQPHPPLAELLLPGLPLLEALGEIGLHLVGAHELPPEGLDALTDRADLDPARGELGHQRGLLGLSVLESVADSANRALVRGFRLACRRDALLESGQHRPCLVGLPGHLAGFDAHGLGVPVFAFVLTDRLFQIFLTGDALGLALADCLLALGDAHAQRRDISFGLGDRGLRDPHRLGQFADLLVQLPQLAFAGQQRVPGLAAPRTAAQSPRRRQHLAVRRDVRRADTVPPPEGLRLIQMIDDRNLAEQEVDEALARRRNATSDPAHTVVLGQRVGG